MHSSIRADQAEGLRRLLVRNHTQVVAVLVARPGMGKISTIFNLAAAIAHSGKEVLVLEEHHAPNNFPDHFGLNPRYDLLDVVRGKCKPHEAVLNTMGFFVLSTARTMDPLVQLNPDERQNLESALDGVSKGVDVILIDAVMPVMSEAAGLIGQATVSSGLASGVSLLVVVDATSNGITDSYALIKRLALENACLQFEIVVNKVADNKAAMKIFGNMAKVARNNLAVHLEYLGYIHCDDRLKRATQLCKPVVEAFPAAISAKSYLELAKKLLRLPMRQNEARGEVQTAVQNLMMHVSQPLRQHSKKVAHVVNC